MINTIIAEHTEHGIIPIDIFTKLASERKFFINGYIDDQTATDLCAAIILQDLKDNTQKISLFINAERGDIRSVFMIYDTIHLIKSPVETVCFGTAMDEVVLLLAAGTKGMRFATESSIIVVNQLIHDKSYYSNLTDAKAILDRSIQDNKDFMKALAKATGKKASQTMKDFKNKQIFTAKQSIKYGIIDEIIKKSK